MLTTVKRDQLAREGKTLSPEEEARDSAADPRQATSTKGRPTTPPRACGTTGFSTRRETRTHAGARLVGGVQRADPDPKFGVFRM